MVPVSGFPRILVFHVGVHGKKTPDRRRGFDRAIRVLAQNAARHVVRPNLDVDRLLGTGATKRRNHPSTTEHDEAAGHWPNPSNRRNVMLAPITSSRQTDVRIELAAAGVVNLWPVSRGVNNMRNNGVALLDCIEDPAQSAYERRVR